MGGATVRPEVSTGLGEPAARGHPPNQGPMSSTRNTDAVLSTHHAKAAAKSPDPMGLPILASATSLPPWCVWVLGAPQCPASMGWGREHLGEGRQHMWNAQVPAERWQLPDFGGAEVHYLQLGGRPDSCSVPAVHLWETPRAKGPQGPWVISPAGCHLLRLGWGCLAHLEGHVVEVATVSERGPAGLPGSIGRHLWAGACSPEATGPLPIASRHHRGSRHIGPLAFGGLLPGHSVQALTQRPPSFRPSRTPPAPSQTRTRTRPAAVASRALGSRAAPGTVWPLRPGPCHRSQ